MRRHSDDAMHPADVQKIQIGWCWRLTLATFWILVREKKNAPTFIMTLQELFQFLSGVRNMKGPTSEKFKTACYSEI